MRVLIQRVKQASVVVHEINSTKSNTANENTAIKHVAKTVGEINHGILAYVGLGHDDDLATAKRMVDKILNYRIFEDDAGKMGLNVQQVAGGVLLVSQFTLLANTAKGLRPDFKPAMAFDRADALFTDTLNYAKTQYEKIATGEFGANMQVHSINDGPINFLLEF